MQPPQVSAVLLTIGEKTFGASYQGLKNQTLPLEEIIVIRDVRPFSKAFQKGVSAVRTPFFIQCDADMILEPNCAERLLQEMNERTGMVVGFLNDPLQSKIQGVKLYRTEHCKQFPMIDSFNCEEIFRQELLKNGIGVVVLDPKQDAVGTHEPDLTDRIYQFERFKFLGAKIYARQAWYDCACRLTRLSRAPHQEVASMAALAMICGLYLSPKSDHLKGYSESNEYRLFCARWTNENRAETANKIYAAAGIYNFLFGYQDGLLWIRNQKHFSLVPMIRNCLSHPILSKWAYLIGFCSSVMNPRESFAQNRISRFRRVKPFLKYLQHNLARIHEPALN